MAKKIKIALNLSRLNGSELTEKASLVEMKMTGNVHFPNPPFSPIDLKNQSELLRAKMTEQAAAFELYKQKSVEVNNERQKLAAMIEQDAAYVENIANGDAAKILSAGYDVRNDSTSGTAITVPQIVSLKDGGANGALELSFRSVKGARSYVVEYTTDVTAPDSWQIIDIITRSKTTITGLKSGTQVWIRVRTVLSNGQSAPSDPATKFVP